ncbi:GatB/YqeY domain-containing protein [Hyphomonas sediminis]|uniref:GatB/YqeY domain-containing protein n=1 Tax=Hyphomonas sediminis TaxID=2866160 RepID=UPI001CED2A50|nr:GatB/YqeY domain-containing protein [Hyphomonas sediminis]
MGREDISACLGLKARILQALKDESAQTDSETRLQTLRLIECAIRDRDVCARGRGEGEGCPDTDVQRVLKIMIAQREESAGEHEEEGRLEEAIREREEVSIINAFLPQPLSGRALDIAVKQVVDDLGASKLKDLGRCVTELKDRYPGQIEAASAGKAVRTALTQS